MVNEQIELGCITLTAKNWALLFSQCSIVCAKLINLGYITNNVARFRSLIAAMGFASCFVRCLLTQAYQI